MGITGVGKSTVGELVADALHLPFVDGDDFHSDEAKAKMHAGIPLDDADRLPWLDRLNRALREHETTGAVLACSALTRAYRSRLVSSLDGVQFVFLTGDPDLIRARISARHGHFAGANLVASQLATLEPPEDAITIDVNGTPEETASRALAALRANT